MFFGTDIDSYNTKYVRFLVQRSKHIASCDPDTLREILAEVEALEAELADIKSDREYIVGWNDGYEHAATELQADNARLREALKAITKVENAEINTGNYTDDDVCNLNNASIETWQIAATALKETGND